MKRRFGNRDFKVSERNVLLGQISSSKKYQRRSKLDQAKERGREIAVKMREQDAAVFADTILCVERNGILYIVDGFGRYETAKILEWDRVDIHVLHGNYDESSIKYISCCANADNGVVTKPFTYEEMAANCLDMFEKQKISPEEIAVSLNTSVAKVNKMIARGRSDRENARNREKLSTHYTFFNGRSVDGTFAKVATKIIRKKETFGSFVDSAKYFEENFSIKVVRAKGCDDQVKGVAFDLLTDEQDEKDCRYLILIYGTHQQPSLEKAREIATQIEELFPGRVMHTTISPDTDDFNVAAVREFIDG